MSMHYMHAMFMEQLELDDLWVLRIEPGPPGRTARALTR